MDDSRRSIPHGLPPHDSTPDRRRFLGMLLGAPVAFWAALRLGLIGEADAAELLLAATTPSGSTRALPATPECDDGDDLTPAETEGPFYTPRTPQRTSLLEPGMTGHRIVLEGRVYSRGCRPVPAALLDFWHADDSGEYDNAGFRLRGHQFADRDGRWRLETIVPGVYPGRTRHFHVKVQAPRGRVLTTQLYFPGEPRNRSDRLFRPDLLMVVSAEDGDHGPFQRARFNFVIGA
jgi:protocatechuate 3,4-dioxygenase beta subunit